MKQSITIGEWMPGQRPTAGTWETATSRTAHPDLTPPEPPNGWQPGRVGGC